jgi:hypothetical protein
MDPRAVPIEDVTFQSATIEAVPHGPGAQRPRFLPTTSTACASTVTLARFRTYYIRCRSTSPFAAPMTATGRVRGSSSIRVAEFIVPIAT